MAHVNELHWLAGILEGEGSFMYRIPKIRSSGYPVISIQNCDHDVIYRIHKLMKTSGIVTLSPRRTRGNVGKTIVYSTQQSKIKECIGWMMTLYPLMSIRRKKKIREIIELWKLAKDNRGRNTNRIL